MKKIIVTLLAAAMLLSCVFVLASCGGNQGTKPELDLEKAAENLEDADYSVTYSDDEDELAVNVAEKLVAYDDDENAIYITVYKDSKSASIAFDALKLEIENEKAYTENKIKEIKNLLSKYEDDFEDDDEIEELEDKLKDLEKELEEFEEKYCYGKSGKTVWYGTNKAAKASK